VVAVLAAAACCLTACDSAKQAAESTASKAADTARSEASAAASKAASEAAEAARKQAKAAATEKVCDLVTDGGPLADGKINASDRALLKAVAPAAERAGVDQRFQKPLDALAAPDSTGYTTRALLGQLTEACA
jgi:hypothetical protein